jgi:hypothetical protein
MVVLFTYQQKMNTNTKKAILELDYLHPDYKKTIDPFIPEILQLIEKFSQSADYVTSTDHAKIILLSVIDHLLNSMPLSPIEFDGVDWGLVFDNIYQNKRCGAIFKDDFGGYYLDAIVWCHKDNHFTGMVDGVHSTQYIKSFPFEPKTFYIDVIDVEVAPDGWEYFIKDPKQLEEVFNYYDKNETNRKDLIFKF